MLKVLAMLGSELRLEPDDRTEGALRLVLELELDADDTKFALDIEELGFVKSPGEESPDVVDLFPMAEDNCKDAGVDGPDFGPEGFERDDTRFLAEFGMLKNDCEDTNCEGLDAGLKILDEEKAG